MEEEGEPAESALDEVGYSSASEGEEGEEEVERPAPRRSAEYPTTEIIPLEYLPDIPPGATPRLLSPLLSRFEYAALLEARKRNLDELGEGEIAQKVKLPSGLLYEKAERARLAQLKYLKTRYETLREQERRGGSALGIIKGKAPRKTWAAPAHEKSVLAQEMAAVKSAIDNIEAETAERQALLPGEAQLFSTYLDTYNVAEEEWRHRKERNPETGERYGPPYFLARKRPDGKTELWMLHELGLRE